MLHKRRLSRDYPDFELNFIRAQKYWDDQLQDQTIIDIPQDKECQISVVVPVYNEDLSTILRQLQSIIAQRNISSSQFEVIYTVNNSPLASPEVVAKNTEVLRLPIWRNSRNVLDDEDYPYDLRGLLGKLKRFNLFVIDKSSPGNEIIDCNVGRARNRGIAEASRRFFTNDIDGLIFQLDADSYYPDPTYFSRVIDQFRDNLALIVLCGGVTLYCDTENYTGEQKLQARLDVALLCEYLKWKSLKFLLLGKSFVFDDDFMSGPNMITKSFPTASVCGVPNVAHGEDVAFGEYLQVFARKYDFQYSFSGAKDLFQVSSLLRLSGGISNNLGANVRTADSGLSYTCASDGQIIFGELPNEIMYVEPIPKLYDKFKQLALKNNRDKFREHIDKVEEKVEFNKQSLLQQLR